MIGFPLDSRVTYVTDPDTGVITPQYDRAVTSKPLKAYIRGIITTGVLPNPSDNLQVFPGTDGMTVIVHAGFAVIDGGLAKEDNNRTLEVTVSDVTYDRIDTVVVRWNDNDSVRNVDLYIKQGVPARNPVRPTLTREGSVYEIGLADIFVTKNVRTITAEKITDTRLESARCGVASSIAKWDTTTIYQQIQSDLAGFKSNEQAEFMTWFNAMKDQLTEDAAGKLQTEVDDVKGQLQNLQVGGRNYLLGSDTALTGDGWKNVGGLDTSFVNHNLGKQVVLSIRYTAEDWVGSRFGFEVSVIYDDESQEFYNVWIYGSANGDTTASSIILLPIVHGKAKKIGVCTLYVQGTTAGTVTIYQPKLELGNIATDWSPAPEDLEVNFFDIVRPVGSLYSTTDAQFNPNTAKGWHGKWERITDCVIYAAGTSDTVGEIVGSNTHTLTEAELPSHRHSIPKLIGKAKSHGIGGLYTALSSTNFGVGFLNNGNSLSNDWPFSGGEANSKHEHDVETNASNTDYTGSGTAIDIRPRRLNSIVWRRIA